VNFQFHQTKLDEIAFVDCARAGQRSGAGGERFRNRSGRFERSLPDIHSASRCVSGIDSAVFAGKYRFTRSDVNSTGAPVERGDDVQFLIMTEDALASRSFSPTVGIARLPHVPIRPRMRATVLSRRHWFAWQTYWAGRVKKAPLAWSSRRDLAF